jgi:chemotaxis signal transduction protein
MRGAKMTEIDHARALTLRAEELRSAFDRAFAAAPEGDVETTCDLLTIRVGGDAYALRLAEVGGLFVDRVVTPLPTLVPELVGIAGFRAALVPVYDLRTLLGYPPGEAGRWLVSTAGEQPVGFSFEKFEAHLRIRQEDLAADDSHARRHVRQIARTSDGARPVVQLSSVLEVIKARAAGVARARER